MADKKFKGETVIGEFGSEIFYPISKEEARKEVEQLLAEVEARKQLYKNGPLCNSSCPARACVHCELPQGHLGGHQGREQVDWRDPNKYQHWN